MSSPSQCSGSFVGKLGKSESDEDLVEAVNMCEEEHEKSDSGSTGSDTGAGTSTKTKTSKRKRVISSGSSSCEENYDPGDDDEITKKINGSSSFSTTPPTVGKSSSNTKKRPTLNDDDDKNSDNLSNVSEGHAVVDLVSSNSNTSSSTLEEEENEESENIERSSCDEEESTSKIEEKAGSYVKHLNGLPNDGFKPPDPGLIATTSVKEKGKKRKKKSDGKTRRVRKKVDVVKSKNRKSIDGKEPEQSEESDNDDNANDNELCVSDSQEVSIHQILLKKVELSDEGQVKLKELKKGNAGLQHLSLKDIIDVIIATYNNKRSKSQLYTEDKGFIEEKIKKEFIPKLRRKDQKHFIGEDFEIKIYTQEIKRKLILMNSYGITSISVVVHTLIFHYREDPREIFALTTGGAWNVVQPFSDLSFPAKIAARILDEKGSLEETNKKIVGNSMTEKTTRKKAQQNNPYKMIELCTGFKAKLRSYCSLFKLEAFRKSNKNQPNETIKMNIGLALVRILKRLTVSDFLTVLSLFSEISRGIKTYKYKPGRDHGEEEIDSDAHLKWLTLVPTDLGRQLDVIFAKKFRDAVRNSEEAKRLGQEFQICHKHTSDYANGHDFALWMKKQVVQDFENHPNIEQLCEEIGLNAPILKIAKTKTDDELMKNLDYISLAFKIEENSKDSKREKLLNLVEGLLENPGDGRIYWKVMTKWCSIRDEYLVIVHSQFLRVLQEVLVLEDAAIELGLEWKKEDTRTTFIDEHKSLPDYILWQDVVTDKGTEYGYFDMVKIIQNSKNDKQKLANITQNSEKNPQKLVLYFIASAFDSQITKVCERIKTTSVGIKWANSHSHTKNPTKLNSNYEDLNKYFDQNEEKFQRNGVKDLKSFLNLLSEATIVLAVAQSLEHGNCSFQRESELLTNLKPEDIERYLDLGKADQNKLDLDHIKKVEIYFEDNADGSNLDMFTNIANLLAQKEYLNSGNYNITNKLLICNERNFRIFENQNKTLNLNSFIFDKVISKVKSGFNFLIPKLEVSALKKELVENPQNEFKIFEIPLVLELDQVEPESESNKAESE